MIEKLQDLELNGSGQVNHTHANMTKIAEKVNELVNEFNELQRQHNVSFHDVYDKLYRLDTK